MIGRDGAALRQAATEVTAQTDSSLHDAETSLEDAFVQLMGEAQDNMK